MVDDIKLRSVYKVRRTDKPDDGTDIYIGSTSQPLRYRLGQHMYNALNRLDDCKNNKLCAKIREVGLSNWEILPLIQVKCDIKSIKVFELGFFNVLKPNLNSQVPIRTQEQIDNYYKINLQNRRYHCGICNKSYGDKQNLKKHLGSLKHKNTYLGLYLD